MYFRVEAKEQNARAGTLKTAHSEIKTPVFMPVGTVGAVKSLDAIDLNEILKPQIILGNTYHLYLRPGDENIKKLGGLHEFENFHKSFLTDSGGFQAFSLKETKKNSDEGIKFKSHIDGSSHFFTPKKVLDIQYNLNSDIMMVLDDLIALPSSEKRIELSLKRTIKWAKESLFYHNEQKALHQNQNIFAIIQGGTSQKYRQICANELCEFNFDGFAIGGLSVGESNEQMYDTVEWSTPFMPKDKPRYLMGVGTPEDLVECVSRGVDMFDCVMPTRNARNGTLFTHFGKINIKSTKFILDKSPIDNKCECYTCKNFTRAYLNHLYRAKELTYFRLASLHNLHYYLNLMKQMREAILTASFSEFKREFYSLRK